MFADIVRWPKDERTRNEGRRTRDRRPQQSGSKGCKGWSCCVLSKPMRRLCCACPAVGPLLPLPIFVLFKVHLMKCRMLKFRCSFALVFRCQKWSALGLFPHFHHCHLSFQFCRCWTHLLWCVPNGFDFLTASPQRFHPGFPSSFSPTPNHRPPPLGRLVI